MALKDKAKSDLTRVFMNESHYAKTHTWNGRRFTCVTDNEAAIKRKSSNVFDLSWDNNTTETVIYVPVQGFPGRAMPNEHAIFDGKPVRILQIQEDEGMYAILICANDPKAVSL